MERRVRGPERQDQKDAGAPATPDGDPNQQFVVISGARREILASATDKVGQITRVNLPKSDVHVEKTHPLRRTLRAFNAGRVGR